MKQRMKWRKKIGKEPENQLEARQGGVGCILLSHLWNYCLKIVPLVKEGKLNGGFWQEARSVFVYRTTVRPMASLLSCPLPVTYWIHKDDASLVKYLATHDKLSQEAVYLDDYLVTMSIDDKPCLQYKDYRLIPDDLLCRIYNKRNSK